MLIVRVELHSARTGEVTEIARMRICNVGVSNEGRKGDYEIVTFRGRSTEQLDQRTKQRSGFVYGHPRLAEHGWKLVRKALEAIKY